MNDIAVAVALGGVGIVVMLSTSVLLGEAFHGCDGTPSATFNVHKVSP